MTNATPHDSVNHPSHYTQYPVEVIELTRHMNFCKGNAVKYVARAGFKGGPEKELEDIDKAIWYLKDEREQIVKRLAEKKNSSNQSAGSITNVEFHVYPSPGLDEDKAAEAASKAIYNKIAKG